MLSARQNAVLALTVSVLVSLIAGCGGGGGGGGSGGGGAGTGAQVLTYSGNTSAALIAGANAAKLTSDIMGGGAETTTGGLTGVAIAGPKPAPSVSQSPGGLGRRLERASRIDGARARGDSQLLLGITVDETDPCDSGSVRVSGTLNDNG